jgi:pimeloyl-ACP methyl ester carboxylesterase
MKRAIVILSLLFVGLTSVLTTSGCPSSSSEVNVPDVRGMAQAAAETAISDASLTVGAIAEQSSNTVPDGNVISQQPAAGTSVTSGTAINLVVSTGPPPPPSIRIEGHAVNDPLAGATVELEWLGTPGIAATTTTNADGSFLFDIPESDFQGAYRLRAYGGEKFGEPFIGNLFAIYAPQDNHSAANLTLITTLIVELAESGQVPDGDPLAERNAAIDLLADIGMIQTDDWWALDPAYVDLGPLRGNVAGLGGVNEWRDAILADLSDSDLSPENMAGFPYAHGGVTGILLDENALQGELFIAEISVLHGLEPPVSHALALLAGPQGMTVDADGVLEYTVPSDAVAGSVPLSFQVTNLETGGSRELDSEIYIMETAVVAEGTVGPEGGIVTDDWDEIILDVPEGAVTSSVLFQVVRAIDLDGLYTYTMRTVPPDAELALAPNLTVPNPNQRNLELLEQSGESAQKSGHVETPWLGDVDDFLWLRNTSGGRGGGDSHVRPNRLPQDAPMPQHRRLRYSAQETFQLWSLCGTKDSFPNSTCAQNIPVLFIHGFKNKGDFGGGEGTWGDFRKLLHDDGYAVFEFKYRSNARYQDVAKDLALALREISNQTGKQVHIVAHSFGGLVTRAYMQGLAGTEFGNEIASLITLGTPHSGIFSSPGERHNVHFPDGTDGRGGLVIDALARDQLSTYQAGQPADIFYDESIEELQHINFRDLYQVHTEPGEIVAAIAALDQRPLPAPVLSLIGLTAAAQVIPVYHGGDNLISFQGQRFHPQLSCPSGSCGNQMLLGAPMNSIGGMPTGSPIMEKFLYFPFDAIPGDLVPEAYRGHQGYHHNNVYGIRRGKFAEPYVAKDTELRFTPLPGAAKDKHYSYYEVWTWLNNQGDPPPVVPETVDAMCQVVEAGTNAPLQGAAVALLADGSSLLTDFTDANGNVSFVDAPFVPDAEYTVAVSKTGYRSHEFERGFATGAMPPAEAFDFGMLPMHPDIPVPVRTTLTGTISDAVTADPISGVSYLITNGSILYSGTTGAQGGYSVPDIAPGNYWLFLTHPDYETIGVAASVLSGQANVTDAAMSPAQVVVHTWAKTFGDSGLPFCFSVRQTNDGGYIAAGITFRFSTGEDAHLVKIDAQGNMEWQRSFGGTGLDGATSVRQTSDGGYVLAGYTTTSGTEPGGSMYLVKVDGQGIFQWERTFAKLDDNIALSLSTTSDGGYILAGSTTAIETGPSEVYVVKTNASGHPQWDANWSMDSPDLNTRAFSAQQTTDGGYLVSTEVGSSTAIWTLNAQGGDRELVGSVPMFGGPRGGLVQQASDGDYVVFGSDLSSREMSLIKMDEQGNQQWKRNFGLRDNNEGTSFQETTDGGFILGGFTFNTPQDELEVLDVDYYVVRTDEHGTLQWQRTYGGSGEDVALSMQQTVDGGFIIAGNTGSFGTPAEAYIIKTDAQGNAPSIPSP